MIGKMRFKPIEILVLLLPIIGYASSHHSHRNCKQVRIAIIDTGLDLSDLRFKSHICKSGHKNFVDNESINDTNGHGTFVAGLIKQNTEYSNYCFLIYKYYSENVASFINTQNEISAMEEAVRNHPDIINYSGGGKEFLEDEFLAIKNHPEIKFVVAAGNEHQNIDLPGNRYYPASYDLSNIYVIGSLDQNGERAESSNWRTGRIFWEIGQEAYSTLPGNTMGHMSGTSMATAIFSGKLVAKLSKTCQYR
jgi:subtilisin family serine protease